MSILKKIQNSFVFFDGGTGTMLQSMGLKQGEMPDVWNITNPEKVTAVHKAYLEAGCNIIKTNTFGANSINFDGKNGRYDFRNVIKAAVDNANNALKQTEHLGIDHYIALDLGSLGKLLKPLGDFDFERAVEVFGETIKCGAECGVDLILIETVNDSYETKAAVLAAKENCDLPVFVTNTYDKNDKLMTGADVLCMVALLEGLKVDALGINCGQGPQLMRNIVSDLIKYSSLPIIVSPNAGLPNLKDGQVSYDTTAEIFANSMYELAQSGARILGGCCGTTPEHIKSLIDKTKKLKIKPITQKKHTVVSSYNKAVEIGNKPILIGERINPTGKEDLKQALRENDFEFIQDEGISQKQSGVDILDVNAGLPDIDEQNMLKQITFELQSVLNLPLQLDTTSFEAMEKAMRIYNGKPMINSVNGKQESMDNVFPLVAKYGGVVVALTLDENGIPDTPQGRLEIAEKILQNALKHNVGAKNIIFDPLAMTISSNSSSATTTLKTISLIKNKLGAKVSLGISNVSFGLPSRDYINSTFFAACLNSGLDAAIMNPFSHDMMKTYYSYLALSGYDENCEGYIKFASQFEQQTVATAKANEVKDKVNENSLKGYILKGLKDQSFEAAKKLLNSMEPLELINSEIIPALDEVGDKYEKKKLFLPQLLMSAEASKSAFEAVKQSLKFDDGFKKGKIILATVKGDIHDIGKNIVKVILENYGYQVIDLGKDVEPELIVKTAADENVKLVGLSALMTTTVSSMEQTIKLLRESKLDCKVIVGGAVLTKEYAEMIGADHYCKDAMETVRYAEKFFK